jgi:TPR repeat protein
MAQAQSPEPYNDQLLKRARSGDAVSQRTVAEDFLHGRGVPQDNAQALKWFRSSADQGDPEALYGLGVLYGGGAKLEFDVKDRKGVGCGYFSQAAGKGYGPAFVEVAGCFRDGRLSSSKSEREVKAAVWYSKAAKSGNVFAEYTLGDLYLHGQGVGKDRVLALDRYQVAAQSGNPAAIHAVAMLKAGNGHGSDDDSTPFPMHYDERSDGLTP